MMVGQKLKDDFDSFLYLKLYGRVGSDIMGLYMGFV